MNDIVLCGGLVPDASGDALMVRQTVYWTQ